jgi:hypothetical protein
MTAEQAYRAALRWYPRSWRNQNEDVVVGTLLDVADAEGRVTPARDELRDLRQSGLSARADVILLGAIRDRVAAISLGAGTAFALAMLTGQAWSPWGAQGSPAEPIPDGIVWQILIHPGLWVLAALAALAGWTILARVFLVATLPASLIAVTSADVSYLLRPSFFMLVMMGVLALLACVGRPPRPWQLIVTGITAAAIASWITFIGPFAGSYFPRGGLIDLTASPLPALLMFIATIVFVLRSGRLAAAAVMVASTPWLVILIGDSLWLTGFAGQITFLFRPLVIGALAVIMPLAIALVARRYARPPWLSPSESSDSRTSASRPSSTR